MSQSNWHIITCEYPPQLGGVSDYTRLVAGGLAEAGDEVHVWCPEVSGQWAVGSEQKPDGRRQEAGGRRQKAEGERHKAGVNVHRELGTFRPSDLLRVSKQLDQFPGPRRLLVQWVPHGYGYRSMNLPFCLWLWRRAKLKGDRVELMVHEPFLAFGEGSRKQDVAAVVHRLMLIMLLNAASRIWISITDWERQLRRFVLGRKKRFTWLPVPSNIPLVDDPAGVAQVRARYASNGTRLVGHFGAYNDYMAEVMSELLPSLLSGENDLSFLLLGRGSIELRDRLTFSYPQLLGRVHATGALAHDQISKHVSACDVMLQPYEDGVSGRRTSVMTALSHSVAVVTTNGRLTDSFWAGTGAVALVSADDLRTMSNAVIDLLADEAERARLSSIGRATYKSYFEIDRTIQALRGGAQDGPTTADILRTEVQA